MMQSDEFNAEEFVRSAIEGLRRELLDFTLRNRLLSFKHSDRGVDYIRAIDELPASLLLQLSAGGVTCKPLPDLDVEPTDEATPEFRERLAAARREDVGKTARDGDAPDDAASPNALAKRERRLRDKVRVALGMEPILVRGGQIDLAALARAHGLVPDYELPPSAGPEREAHNDKFIQTCCCRIFSIGGCEKSTRFIRTISKRRASTSFMPPSRFWNGMRMTPPTWRIMLHCCSSR